jgi:hypothetical protein
MHIPASVLTVTSTEIFAVIVGFSVSFWLQSVLNLVAVLEASIYIHVTVVGPLGKIAGYIVAFTDEPGQLSQKLVY